VCRTRLAARILVVLAGHQDDLGPVTLGGDRLLGRAADRPDGPVDGDRAGAGDGVAAGEEPVGHRIEDAQREH
jgi:hypothetical protein